MKIRILYFLALVLTIISCSSKGQISKIDCKIEAFSAYGEFQKELGTIENISTPDLIVTLEKWKMLEDTVLHFMIADTTLDKAESVQYMIRCATIGNYISDEMLRLADSKQRTYKDIILVQQSFNNRNNNTVSSSALQEAEVFFNRLDDKVQADRTASENLAEYTNRLTAWNSEGFISKKEMLDFISEENHLFINFLNYLYEYDEKSVRTVIKTTAKITELLVQASSDRKIAPEDLIAYMGVRTNRRLIQNARRCMDAVNRNQVKTRRQAAMTISMLLNPYSNYNQLCIETRTEKQVKELYSIGEQMESLFEKLQKQKLTDGLKLDSLPNKLIKEQILITMK
ncbi:hypothetical protein [Bacteroides sp.]|jgi:hypothetical protein|uniref:hypothetical protein n=1 Tax=Bacteroides sp. TaxID=29523 RepID=UPI002608D1EE|nr:hypothetical protein [Bacteroides sp.]MDD3038101.1 hypothetical protein [Bacteroides sp.]